MRARIATIAVFLVTLALLLLSIPLWATDCKGNQPCNDTILNGGDNIVDNSTVIEGSSALGFGRSSFDVDINQCMGSTSWDTILVGKQKLILNKWCAAEVYDAKGLHDMAAVMRCDIPEVIKHFAVYPDCIEANTVAQRAPASEAMLVEPDRDDEVHEEYEERIEQLEQSRRVIVQQPYLSEDKKQKLREIVDD